MIFHASIAADNPGTAASFLAELWDGEAFPFHPVHGAFIVLQGDEHGSAIEIYPAGTVIRLGKDGIGFHITDDLSRETATHLAVATQLGEKQVFDLAATYGWWARQRDRGPFELIEVWIDGKVLVEVLTPRMQERYRSSMAVDNWRDWS